MYAQNAIVRTYCPGVRVGNWFESIALEEVGCCLVVVYNNLLVTPVTQKIVVDRPL